MRHSLRIACLGIGALWLAGSAHAQYGGSYNPDTGGPYSRTDRYSYGRLGQSYRGDIVDRVLSDLDRSQGYNRFGGNRKELENARRDLLRFREKAARGDFDRGRLDSAIKNIDRLVKSPGLSAREREMLSRDLYALRDFRSSRGYEREGRGYRY